MWKLTELNESQIVEIRKLESKWKNIILLAYEKPVDQLRIPQEQLKILQKLEKELGVHFVACK